MAVKIRLTRMGDKKSPFYRLVAADSRTARDGKYIENLGTYNPLVTPAKIDLNKERVEYWLGCGATPTDTAKELLIKEGIIAAKPFRAPLPKKMPPAKKEASAEEAQVVEGGEQQSTATESNEENSVA